MRCFFHSPLGEDVLYEAIGFGDLHGEDRSILLLERALSSEVAIVEELSEGKEAQVHAVFDHRTIGVDGDELKITLIVGEVSLVK